ncbi:MAG: hypothetical protein HY304_05970 [candidate division Zixibacteria bacterium]|nr:hypothetical protein [candidate division Zixibacteria bacterium]
MRCYFWGTNNLPHRDQGGRGLACFAIPDWGVQFRTAHEGTASECEYTALLSLLRFVGANPKVFEGKRLEILSDAAALVEQVNRRLPSTPAEAKSLTLVRALRDRIPFDLLWIPPDQNRAIQGVLGLAPLRTKIPLEFAPHDRPSPPRRFTPDDLLS